MWARAAWAVLLGYFVVTLYWAQMAFAAPNVTEAFKSEFCDLDRSKSVAILNGHYHHNFETTLSVLSIMLDIVGRPREDKDWHLSPWPDDALYFCKRADFLRVLWRNEENASLIDYIVSWRLPAVLQRDIGSKTTAGETVQSAVFWKNISPQLSVRRVLSTADKFDGGVPKHPRDDSYKPLSRLNGEERDLRSGIATALLLWCATLLYLRRWTFLGLALSAYAIFGFLLRVDLWSLLKWIA